MLASPAFSPHLCTQPWHRTKLAGASWVMFSTVLRLLSSTLTSGTGSTAGGCGFTSTFLDSGLTGTLMAAAADMVEVGAPGVAGGITGALIGRPGFSGVVTAAVNKPQARFKDSQGGQDGLPIQVYQTSV